jgi:uncharacterized membrane protein YdjX (TVP38/TMEM64 family)
MELSKEKKIFIAILLILAAIILLIRFIEGTISISELKTAINSFGPWVPLVLLVIIIVTSSIGFVFTIPVAISALLLNIYWAFAISILGLTSGATISFYLARGIGREYVEKRFVTKIKALKSYDKKLHKRGFLTIFFLRLIMLIPYELINIAAGLSRIDFGQYILATFLGIMPGTMLTIYFVRSTNNVLSVQFILALIFMTLFAILPLLSRKVRDTVFNIRK